MREAWTVSAVEWNWRQAALQPLVCWHHRVDSWTVNELQQLVLWLEKASSILVLAISAEKTKVVTVVNVASMSESEWTSRHFLHLGSIIMEEDSLDSEETVQQWQHWHWNKDWTVEGNGTPVTKYCAAVTTLTLKQRLDRGRQWHACRKVRM